MGVLKRFTILYANPYWDIQNWVAWSAYSIARYARWIFVLFYENY